MEFSQCWLAWQPAVQEPHLESSELQSSSHPSSELPFSGPLQSPKPLEHVGVQSPPVQLRLLTWLLEHTALHAPQCATLLSESISHPSSVAPGRGPLQSR